MHFNLKAKFAIITGATILSVALLLTTFLTRQQARTIREELLTRAVALTENLAYNAQLPIAAENKQSLHRLAQGLMRQTDVSYVEFLDTNGTDLHREGAGPGWPLEVKRVHDSRVHASGARSAWVTVHGGRSFLDVQTMVVVEASEEGQEGDILSTQRQTEDVTLGTVRVGFSTAPAQAVIDHVRSLGLAIGLIVSLVASIVAALLIHVMTRPLSQLMEGNRRVARGDFGLRLEVRAGDEFGRLAGSYNQMADEIQRSRELAESYLASLRSNADHLEEANRALQQSNAELAKASRMKSEFLAVMSHELRTPLNVIIGFSEVLLDKTFGELNPKQGRYVENVLSSGRHLLSLINDILDLSKVEAGRMQVSPEPFDLRQSLDEIQGLVRTMAAKKNVALQVAPVPTLTPITDQKLFKQVMLNLLSNAIKFTPEGGRIDLDARSLDGRLMRNEEAARPLPPERRLAIPGRRVLLVEVRDTGVGIASDEHDKIFQAFRQVDASYSRKQEGTGLGLALTRRIVQLLGGDIWFASAPGMGSRFWFYLPFEFRDGEDAKEAATELQVVEAMEQVETTAEIDYEPVREGDVGIEAGSGIVADADWPWGGDEVEGAEASVAETAKVEEQQDADDPIIGAPVTPTPTLTPTLPGDKAKQASSPKAEANVPESEAPAPSTASKSNARPRRKARQREEGAQGPATPRTAPGGRGSTTLDDDAATEEGPE